MKLARIFPLFLATILSLGRISALSQAETSFTLGEQAYRSRDFSQALVFYLQAVQKNPHYFEALRGAALSYYFLGQYREAQVQAERASLYKQDDAPLLALRGSLSAAGGDFAKARSALSRYGGLYSFSPDATSFLAGIDYVLGNRSKGYEESLQNAKLHPANTYSQRSFFLIASLYHPGQAEAQLDRLLRYAPTKQSYALAARYYFRIGRLAAAEQAYELARDKGASSDPSLRLLGGDIASAFGRPELAAKRYLSVASSLQDATEYPDVYFRLGLSYSMQHKTAQAYSALALAHSSRPDDRFFQLFLRTLVLRSYGFKSPERQKEAQELSRTADSQEQTLLLRRAFASRRLALRFDPLSPELHLQYSDLLDKLGYDFFQVQELTKQQSKGALSPALSRRLKNAETRLKGNLAPFVPSSYSRVPIFFFIIPNETNPLLAKMASSFFSYYKRTLESQGAFKVLNSDGIVSSDMEVQQILRKSTSPFPISLVLHMSATASTLLTGEQVLIGSASNPLYPQVWEHSFQNGDFTSLNRAVEDISTYALRVADAKANLLSVSGGARPTAIIGLGLVNRVRRGDQFYVVPTSDLLQTGVYGNPKSIKVRPSVASYGVLTLTDTFDVASRGALTLPKGKSVQVLLRSSPRDWMVVKKSLLDDLLAAQEGRDTPKSTETAAKPSFVRRLLSFTSESQNSALQVSTSREGVLSIMSRRLAALREKQLRLNLFILQPSSPLLSPVK